MRTFATLICLAGGLAAAPIPKEAKQDDLGRFDGLWWEARCNDNVAPNLDASRQFTFKRDGSAGILQKAGGHLYPYTFALESGTSPRSFAWKPVGGGTEYVAIYRFDGDMLYIVFTDSKKATPKEVKPGVGDVYYELKKVK